MGGQVVQHDVHVGAGVRLDGLLEKVEEVRPGAGGLALPEHLAGAHVQRGEQVRRAVPHVVVGAFLGRVERDREHGLGPIQGLDLGLLIDRQHHRPARWVEVEADHVGYLGGELRVLAELERAVPVRLQPGLPPQLRHVVVRDVHALGALDERGELAPVSWTPTGSPVAASQTRTVWSAPA